MRDSEHEFCCDSFFDTCPPERAALAWQTRMSKIGACPQTKLTNLLRVWHMAQHRRAQQRMYGHKIRPQLPELYEGQSLLHTSVKDLQGLRYDSLRRTVSCARACGAQIYRHLKEFLPQDGSLELVLDAPLE